MQLKDFVAESIKQIVDGIVEAQTYCKDKGGLINPNDAYPRGAQSQTDNLITVNDGRGAPYILQILDFDVAVTAIEGEQAKAGISVLGGDRKSVV